MVFVTGFAGARAATFAEGERQRLTANRRGAEGAKGAENDRERQR